MLAEGVMALVPGHARVTDPPRASQRLVDDPVGDARAENMARGLPKDAGARIIPGTNLER